MLGTILFLAVGILAFVAAGVLIYFRRRTLRKAGLMHGTETTPAAAVSGLAPGTLVEVKGTLRCDAPLTSEMADQSCAYYSSRVSRQYTRRNTTDRPGSNRRSETISHSERFAPFAVEDASAGVAVNAEGAEVDAEKVVDRFERYTEGGAIPVGDGEVQVGGGERTLGFRYCESILRPDEPVYVLGTVQEGGGIGLSSSADADTRFIVSHRSEEELSRSYVKNARVLGLIAVGLLVFGAIFAAIGIAAAFGYAEIEQALVVAGFL